MISQTALLCALARAVHTHDKSEKIFEDPFALDFVSLKDYRNACNLAKNFFPAKTGLKKSYLAKDLLNQYFLPIILPRNRFAEDIVEAKRKEGKVQYVLLGAGLDSFALRNKSENVEVFELDLRETQTFKIERVKKLVVNNRSNVHFVEIDFNKDSVIDKLLNAGFNPNTPSVFSILGVSYYIPIEIFFKTVSQISQIAASGSGLVFDYYEKEKTPANAFAKIARLKQIASDCGERMAEGYDPDQVAELVKESGFDRCLDLAPKDIDRSFFEARSGLSAFEGVHLIYGEK